MLPQFALFSENVSDAFVLLIGPRSPTLSRLAGPRAAQAHR